MPMLCATAISAHVISSAPIAEISNAVRLFMSVLEVLSLGDRQVHADECGDDDDRLPGKRPSVVNLTQDGGY
jgi:hypothetical protein